MNQPFQWPEEALQPWLEALHAGEVVAAPAEGVYGYCCDPFHEGAIEKLMALKQRPKYKGFITLAPSQINAEEHFKSSFTPPFQSEKHQPITFTFDANNLQGVPASIKREDGGLPLRIPTCDYMQAYLQAWGKPLVSTSLNLSGQPPALRASEIPPHIPALTLPHMLSGQPSRIYNVTEARFIR